MEERFKYNPGKLESYANRNGRGGIACSTRSFDWLNFNQHFSLQYIVGIRKQRNRTENRTTRISFNIVPKWGMMFFLSPSIIEERGALFRGPLFPRVITLKFNLCIIQRKREIEERRPVSCARFERKKEEGGVDVRRPINMEPNYFFAQITFSRRNLPSFEHFFFFLFPTIEKKRPRPGNTVHHHHRSPSSLSFTTLFEEKTRPIFLIGEEGRQSVVVAWKTRIRYLSLLLLLLLGPFAGEIKVNNCVRLDSFPSPRIPSMRRVPAECRMQTWRDFNRRPAAVALRREIRRSGKIPLFPRSFPYLFPRIFFFEISPL